MQNAENQEIPFGINLTKRYVSEGAEKHLFKKDIINNHGEIILVDYMGSDSTIERVATLGFGTEIFPEKPYQRDFVHYLANNGILEPFKSVQLKFSIQSPIETALTFVYEPTVNVNEYSGRYSVMIDTSLTHSIENILVFNPALSSEKAREIQNLFIQGRQIAYRTYKELIELDLARELSRSCLGIDNDTRYFWKIDLLSLANFIKKQRALLPIHSHTRNYVEHVASIAKEISPYGWEALMHPNTTHLTLTMPTDDEIVDPPLNPPLWKPKETKRVIVSSLEEILFTPHQLLNHGQLQAVDYMGDDSSFAQAARTSYGEGTKKIQDDQNLIKSLIRDLHTTPIEMAELSIESKTPVFVDPRQAGRHRTLDNHGFMGYTPIGSQFYFPNNEEFKYQDRLNRQGREKAMKEEEKARAKVILEERLKSQQELSRKLRELGAPEFIVRNAKGVGFYTKRWRTGETHNWNHYLMLRLDSHAQKEMREQAKLINEIHRLHTPTANEALNTYIINALRLNEKEISLIINQKMLRPDIDIEDLNTYKGIGFVIKKIYKEGNIILDEQGNPVLELGREGLAFKEKLKKLLGR